MRQESKCIVRQVKLDHAEDRTRVQVSDSIKKLAVSNSMSTLANHCHPRSRTFFSAMGTSLSKSLRATLLIGSELSTTFATYGLVR